MKIGIDGKPLCLSFSCGIKTYAVNLLSALIKIDKKNIYYIFTPLPVDIFSTHANIRNIYPAGRLRRSPWQLVLPHLAKQQTLDLFHFLQQHGSIFLKHPRIITTVHDLAGWDAYPNFNESIKYFLLARYVMHVRHITIKKSKTLIADSSSVCNQLRGLYSHAQIEHVPIAPDPIYGGNLMHKKSNPFFLALADLSPRKNIASVLQAFAHLPQNIKSKYLLHIVLSTPFPLTSIKRNIRQLHIQHLVKLHIGISDRKLKMLYAQAIALVYPSLYEGFGLPILEAMQMGCPVITANRTATKEIAGKAALLINPNSIFDICSAMQKMTSPKTQDFYKLRGLVRCKRFSWNLTARKTLSVYEKVKRT